jgi:hypothetical protein
MPCNVPFLHPQSSTLFLNKDTEKSTIVETLDSSQVEQTRRKGKGDEETRKEERERGEKEGINRRRRTKRKKLSHLGRQSPAFYLFVNFLSVLIKFRHPVDLIGS